MYILCIYWQHLKEKVQLMESSNALFLWKECARFCTGHAKGHESTSDCMVASEGLFVCISLPFAYWIAAQINNINLTNPSLILYCHNNTSVPPNTPECGSPPAQELWEEHGRVAGAGIEPFCGKSKISQEPVFQVLNHMTCWISQRKSQILVLLRK